jgi:hypothetical protein
VTGNSEKQPDDGGIFGNLPATRPQRRSAKRDAPASTRLREGSSQPQPAADEAPIRHVSARESVQPPSNSEIVASALATVGELAQNGIQLGEQVVRGVFKRIPKP